MKDLKSDRNAFLLNLGPLMIVTMLLCMVVSVTSLLHYAEIGQDGIPGTLYAWSWLIVGLAAGFFMAKWLADPKAVLIIAVLVAVVWYVVMVR